MLLPSPVKTTFPPPQKSVRMALPIRAIYLLVLSLHMDLLLLDLPKNSPVVLAMSFLPVNPPTSSYERFLSTKKLSIMLRAKSLSLYPQTFCLYLRLVI